MKNSKLQEKIEEYILDTRNPLVNFWLGYEYEKVQQFAMALSHYLRCAELTNNEDLGYECLLRSWLCIKLTGRRPMFEYGQLLEAISHSPHRPEAYYYLCPWFDHNGECKHFDTDELYIRSKDEVMAMCYSYSCIGLTNINNKGHLHLQSPHPYPGEVGLLFYKGFSAWHRGKLELSKDIFIDLYENYELPDYLLQPVINNLWEHRISTDVLKKFNKTTHELLLKEPWRNTEWPTLEITTTIPKKGCVVDCVFCPQRTLQKIWDSKHFTSHKERTMTMEQFKMVIGKLPKEVRITFSGFIEPFMNKHCSDMMVYAHEQGHRVSAFTTAVGMTLEDVEKIKNIPFCGGPNGGFTLHLPDDERRAKHPITDKYIEVVEALKNYNISNFMVMAMGTVHNKVEHLYPDDVVNKYTMWHRAGNLIGEAQLKPELVEVMDEVQTVFRDDKRTCGCEEELYHNILLPNGDVSLCCMDYNLEEIIGNLYSQEYNDILPEMGATFDMCSRCENGIISKQKNKNGRN